MKVAASCVDDEGNEVDEGAFRDELTSHWLSRTGVDRFWCGWVVVAVAAVVAVAVAVFVASVVECVWSNSFHGLYWSDT